MSKGFDQLRWFLRELKRRNVYKVAVTYAVVGYALMELADMVFVRLGLPEWTVTFVIVVIAIGFPLAIIITWAFELTPEGVAPTPSRDDAGTSSADEGEQPGGESGSGSAWLLVVALAGLAVLAVVAGGRYLVDDDDEAEARISDRSIAVLPFEQLGQSEPDVFTEGMHDDLLARLSNVSDLKVISRTAVQQYRDTDMTTGDIARELGVRWVLEGGVQEMGDELQVNAQLIDPRTETHAWADSYRRDLTAASLFDLQSEITKRITRSLEAELTSGERDRMERRPTEDLDAYRLYVRGRSLLDRRTAPSIDKARVYFERALERDSDYALAWVGLADARSQYAAYKAKDLSAEFVRQLGAALPEAREFVRRALTIDPVLAEAHASLGLIHYYEQITDPDARNGPAGVRELQRALELKPSYAEAHHWLAVWKRDLGRLGTALEHLHLAVELSPENVAARRGFAGVLLADGQYEEALTQARRLQEALPDRETGPALAAAALVHLKRWQEVRDTVRPHLTGSGESPIWASTFQALAEVADGDADAARSRLKDLRRRSDDRTTFARMLVKAGLGRDEEALSMLVEGFSEEDGFPDRFNSALMQRSGLLDLRYLYSDILGPVRETPRFRELIEELNVSWGLNPDGSLPDDVDVSFEGQSDE